MRRIWKLLPVLMLIASSAQADPTRAPQRNPEPTKPAPAKVAPAPMPAKAPATTQAPPKTVAVKPPTPPSRCAKLAGVDRMICGDAELARLDARTTALYRKALAGAADPGSLKATYRDWVALERDRCGNVTCLRDAYRREIAELNAFTAP